MIDQGFKTAMLSVGLDADKQIARFMDREEMFLKFLNKFFEAAGPVVDKLQKAVLAKDYPVIEDRAHALKGLSGNIGLESVFITSKKIVDDVRAGIFDFIDDDFEIILKNYNTALRICVDSSPDISSGN